MSEQRKRAFEVITYLQAKKQPHEDERVALWAELEELLDTVRHKEAAIREKIKAVQEQVKPLDALMVEADQAGKLKSKTGADKLLTDIEARAKNA